MDPVQQRGRAMANLRRYVIPAYRRHFPPHPAVVAHMGSPRLNRRRWISDGGSEVHVNYQYR
jgi:hypothetical protein